MDNNNKPKLPDKSRKGPPLPKEIFDKEAMTKAYKEYIEAYKKAFEKYN